LWASARLDAVGCLTEVIIKGIKFATTMFAVTALFGSLRATVLAGLGPRGRRVQPVGHAAGHADRFIVGVSVEFLSASLLIRAAAQRVAMEVRDRGGSGIGFADEHGIIGEKVRQHGKFIPQQYAVLAFTDVFASIILMGRKSPASLVCCRRASGSLPRLALSPSSRSSVWRLRIVALVCTSQPSSYARPGPD
jgi:hypothetical protein